MANTCPPDNTPDYEVDDEENLFVVFDNVESSSSSSESSDANDGGVPDQCSDDPEVYCFTYAELQEICATIGLSPENIDGIVVQLIAQHFSDPASYIYSQLGDIRWRPDPGLSDIGIFDFTSVRGASDVQVPAFVLNNLGQNPSRMAIGDLHYHTSERPGATGYARMMQGQHRIMALGRSEGQAKLLATELAAWLTTFSSKLVQDLPFYDFQVTQRQQARLFEDLGNLVGVGFGITYAYLWSWEINPDAPPLTAISTTIDY